MTTETLPAQVPELDKKSGQLLNQAYDFVIETGEEFEKAGAFLKVVKGLQKEIDSTFKPVIDAAYKTHKEAVAAKKKHSEPLDQAEKIVKGKASEYLTVEKKRVREEEARLRVEAEKKAEEERLARAVEAEDMGASQDDVNEVLHEVVPIAPVMVDREVPKVPGISTTGRWKFRVTDKKALPEEYKMANEKAIRSTVNGLKSETRIPGIEIWEETGIGVRT